MVKNKQGNKFQILPNEVYQREDGPAIVYLDGDKEWCQIVNYTEKMAQLLNKK